MKKTVVFIAICWLLLVSGCMVNKPVEGYSQQRIIETPRGTELVIPSEIESYAVLNKSVAETLVGLGFEENITVLNKESLYLGNFRQVKEVFDINDPNIYKLLSAKPEIIIVDTETLEKLAEENKNLLMKSNIPIVVLDVPKNLQDVRKELEFLVELTNAEYGDRMLEDFNEKLAEIKKLQQERGTYIPGYIQLSETKDQVTTIGNDTFLSDVLKEAGINNVFSDVNGKITTTKNDVAEKNPKVFIIISNDERVISNVVRNPIYKNIDAIKEGNVVIVEKIDRFNPNYKCVDWILSLERKIYS